MGIIIGAAICAFALSFIFLLPALAYLWALDRRVDLDEHDPDFPAITGPVVYPIPEPSPEPAVEPPAAVTVTLRPTTPHTPTPTLTPSTTKEVVTPLRAYADRKEVNQNHELLILNPKS